MLIMTFLEKIYSMKCEGCDCKTYIIHMTKNHKKLCADCFKEAKPKNKVVEREENG